MARPKQEEREILTENKTKARSYEEWRVKPIYKKVTNEDTGEKIRVVDTYEKTENKPIRVTHISPAKAEVLNAQSENTLTRFYETK